MRISKNLIWCQGRLLEIVKRRYSVVSNKTKKETPVGRHAETKQKPRSEFYSERPEYPPIRPPFDSETLEATKFEKREFGEFVRTLPTVEQKINAVSPYERKWSSAEFHRHRDYMYPLVDPRWIYRVHAVPERYNMLPFYQYITKTNCVEELPKFYEDINVDREVDEFTPTLLEFIRNEIASSQWNSPYRKVNGTQFCANIADQIIHTAAVLFGEQYPHLVDAQVSRNANIEAFWIRGGFETLYTEEERAPGWHKYGGELPGDDRRKRGEFAFCLREKCSVTMRHSDPLPVVAKSEDPLCHSPVTPYIYCPLTLGLLKDTQGPLWMTPGYEYGDRNEFGSVHFFPINTTLDSVKRYPAADPADCTEETLKATGIALAFASLTGEAHYMGFTQYNDVTYPFCTQIIQTDGQNWHFLVYQLNSIGIANSWEEQQLPTNIAWCSRKMKLFENMQSNGECSELNKDVVKLLLRFLLHAPVSRPGLAMRPYLSVAAEEALK